MREHTIGLSRRTFLSGAAALGALSFMAPTAAFAETAAEKQAEADAVRNQLVGLQADLETAADNYYKAIEEQDAAKAAMEAEQAKIDDANTQIASLQDKLGTRARSMYRSGSTSFLDFVLGASSFEEFTQNWDLLNQMNENDADMVDQTKTLREELQAAKDEYARQESIAAAKAAEAKQIQDETEAKVNQATELVNSLDAEARELLEQEQAAAAAAAAAQAAAEAEAKRLAEEAANTNNNSGNNYNNNGGGNSDGGNNGGGGGGGTVVYPSRPVGSYDSVVGYAMSRIGCPYVWAAEGPDAFDCSGLVTWAYRQVGISLPHQSESQKAAASYVGSVSEARPGDVLWRYGHVGIAVSAGGSHYVHAPTFGAYVRDTDSLSWAQFTNCLQF
ncbi:NlpC/P60 family protein [Eggerthella sinensis]|uniref:Hydrolase Nlp/P60 n=4 Tax=Eggerthella sinensis TaxID=242230 RepID=A0A3N0IV02_9ACTN|nr:C40 family peptidase [Eggerthella sinensis]RDB65046.1 hydrolase Nlp/P60 [Eggerthella sinensis]RNM40824.1 hydrolase Nlp/P60 [Eggerthella sinensis]